MNYDKTIMELLGRIQALEEQVAFLMQQQKNIGEQEDTKMTTENIRKYIEDQKRIAKSLGKTVLILRSGDVHNALGLKQRHPQVCNAMRHCMGLEDTILHQPPKGNGTTLQIAYKL